MKADLRYPIGPPVRHLQLAAEQRLPMIETVALMPARLRAAVSGLNATQLDTPYRQGGWTVRQVVHHLADSHMNSFVRFKLALTEDAPTIKTYEEARWAETADAKTPPVDLSLALLENLHARWALLMRSMAEEDWARKLTHPERGVVTLDENLCVYDWHCRHHVAHITTLREREGWD
jgi:DinB superfamily